MQFWTIFFITFISIISLFKAIMLYLHASKKNLQIPAQLADYYNQNDYIQAQSELIATNKASIIRLLCSLGFIIAAISLEWFSKTHDYLSSRIESVLWQNTGFFMLATFAYLAVVKTLRIIFPDSKDEDLKLSSVIRKDIQNTFVKVIVAGVFGFLLSYFTQNLSSMIGLSMIISIVVIWHIFIRHSGKNRKSGAEILFDTAQTIEEYYQNKEEEEPPYILDFLKKENIPPQQLLILSDIDEELAPALCFSSHKYIYFTSNALTIFNHKELFALIIRMSIHTKITFSNLRKFVLTAGLLTIIFACHFVLSFQPFSFMLGAHTNVPVLNLLALTILATYINIIHQMFTTKIARTETALADKLTLKQVDKATLTETYKKLYGFSLLRTCSNEWATSFVSPSVSLQDKLRKIEQASE